MARLFQAKLIFETQSWTGHNNGGNSKSSSRYWNCKILDIIDGHVRTVVCLIIGTLFLEKYEKLS